MAQAIGILGMFASILVILRWFKQDTTEMMKIYSEATDIRLAAMDKVIAEIKDDVKAIKEDVRDFHNRLCAIEEKNKGK